MTDQQKKLTNFIKKWEGGLSKNTNDTASKFPCPTPHKGIGGYHTNKGITYSTWVSFYGKNKDEEFFNMTDEQWFNVFSKGYYNPMLKITDDELLLTILSSWAWGSGVIGAIKLLQRSIGTIDDGVFGDKSKSKFSKMVETMGIYNFAVHLCNKRGQFYINIATGRNAIFLKGWQNRLNDFRKTFL